MDRRTDWPWNWEEEVEWKTELEERRRAVAWLLCRGRRDDRRGARAGGEAADARIHWSPTGDPTDRLRLAASTVRPARAGLGLCRRYRHRRSRPSLYRRRSGGAEAAGLTCASRARGARRQAVRRRRRVRRVG